MTDQTPNPTPENSIKTFPFDVPTVEVDIDVSSSPTSQKIISARMNRPTKEQLTKREGMTLTEIVEASATEDDIKVEEERASAWLFDEIAFEVLGVVMKGEDRSKAKEWRPVTPALLDALYPSYKAAFVRGMYNVGAKFVDDEGEGVVLGGDDTLPVKLFFGEEEDPQFEIMFDVPEPTETERRTYSNDAVKLRQLKGSRKSRNRIISNIGVSVRLFDAMMSRDGAAIHLVGGIATVNGNTFDKADNPISRQVFLDAIDPTYKRHIVSAAMSKYNAKVSD